MQHDVLRVLLVEDDEDDYLLTSGMLASGTRHQYAVTWARDIERGLVHLKSGTYDVCLLDYRVGNRTGLELLQRAAELGASVPIILLTGLESPDVDASVLRTGAADYLVKGSVTTALLERSIFYAVERARNVAALRRSEHLLRTSINSLDSHIAILDRNGRIVATNAAWNCFAEQNDLGDRNFGVGSSYVQVCERAAAGGDTDSMLILDKLREVLAGSHSGFVHEYPCVGPDSERWFRLHLYPMQDGAGAVVAHEDITSRVTAERQRQASERRFRALIENSTDHLLLLGPQARLKYVSPSVLKLLGYAPDDLGEQCRRLIHADDLHAAAEAFRAARANAGAPHVVELRVRERSGEWLWMECVLNNLLNDADVQAIVVNCRDITARKHAELALRESEMRYRELFGCAVDLVYCTDLEGRIVWLNRAAEKAFGLSLDQADGVPIDDLVAPEYREALTRQLSGNSVVQDLEMISRTGQRLPIEANTTILYHAGKRAGVLCIGRDVTERRRSERFEQGRRAVLESVAQNHPLPQILEELARLVEQQYSGSACVVRLVEGETLPIAAATDRLPQPCRDVLRAFAVDSSDAPPCVAALERRPVLVDNTAACEKETPRTIAEFGVHAWWVFPLQSAAGQVIGTLEVLREQPGLPEPGDLTLDKAVHLAALTIEHRQLTDQLAHQAQHDPLTGLPNRVLFEDRLQQLISMAHQRKQRVVVLFLDLDNFKHINDTLGHHAGDELLRQATNRLRLKLRPADTLARLGGDEFSITAALDRRSEEPNALAQRVMEAFRSPFQIEGHEIYVTTSVGLSVYPRDAQTAEALLQRADSAMYRAKMRGKNAWQSFSPDIARASTKHLQLQSDLRGSIERGEFDLVYQPQLDLATGELSGFEVLLRWEHPTRGQIAPSVFIPLAEESGLIVPIGSWVLEQACRQGMHWQNEGYAPVRLGINVSALQFARRGWPGSVSETLTRIGFPPECLDLELTESVVMHNVAESVRSMKQLRAMGVGISVDDFGTGYSSLAYLQRLPIDRLKIDVSFVQDIRTNTSEAPLVRAIIGLAHSLGIRVVAEGVETRHQMQTLRRFGCEEIQGFYVGRPVRAAQAGTWLRRRGEEPLKALAARCSSGSTQAGLETSLQSSQ